MLAAPLLLAAAPLPAAQAAVTHPSPGLPMAINTWGGPFTAATSAAYLALAAGASALDAVQAGCAACESARCDGSVGYGGSPDEACETTLDALVMDGSSFAVGAVAALRRVRDAAAVARAVMERSAHTLLAGDQATAFAVQNGFVEQSLSTEASAAACRRWEAARCQPNFRRNVQPDARASCGPYTPAPPPPLRASPPPGASRASHDTLSLVALHASGRLAAATTTNGAAHKMPGRVGDGPIPGSGSYVDSDVGGCGATGDGDIMMRFLPCYQAVESMRRGMSPADAAADAVARIAAKFPSVKAGLVVVDKDGRHAGAAVGWEFTYAYRAPGMDEPRVVAVEPLNAADAEL